MNESEKNIVANIEKYGCHINSVFDPEGEEADFTYTIGIERSHNQPELIVLGLRKELGAWVANEYNRRVAEGQIFNTKDYYGGFLLSLIHI